MSDQDLLARAERMIDSRGRGVIKNPSVLDSNFEGVELVDTESRKQYANALMDYLLGRGAGVPTNIFIYGGSGSGKTIIGKKVGFIATEALNRRGNPTQFVYVSCRSNNTYFSVLREIGITLCLKKMERSPSDIIKKVLTLMNSGTNLIVVLDEIDFVVPGGRGKEDLDTLIFNLSRLNTQSEVGRIMLIMISSKYSVKELLSNGTLSSLKKEEMVFKPYNASDIKQILLDRIHAAFSRRSFISDGGVELIAAYAAQERGDARYAIDLLRRSSEIVIKEGKDKIRDEDIRSASRFVAKDLLVELVESLPEGARLFLLGICVCFVRGVKNKRLANIPVDFITTGEAYEGYIQVCKGMDNVPKTFRWITAYITELECMGLLMVSLSGKGFRGSSRIIRLCEDPAVLEPILKKSLGFD